MLQTVFSFFRAQAPRAAAPAPAKPYVSPEAFAAMERHLGQRITNAEARVRRALEAGQPHVAHDIADEVAALENERATLKDRYAIVGPVHEDIVSTLIETGFGAAPRIRAIDVLDRLRPHAFASLTKAMI